MEITTKYNYGDRLFYVQDHEVHSEKVLGIKIDSIRDGDKECLEIIYKLGFEDIILAEVNEKHCFLSKKELVDDLWIR